MDAGNPWLRKKLPAVLMLVLLWSAARLLMLRRTGIPEPAVHDEFSYLLGADTFAHGRLANPSHPLGAFFESPHILVRPTYASKYPPGQAMFLALGQRLFGSPFYGVVIGNAFMLFTFGAMLCAWVSLRWALAVCGMFALVLLPPMYWTNSYWGGSVAASGGALVLLAAGLAREKQTWLTGAVLALGILLLFWTRPFEGGVFTAAMLAVFARQLWRGRTLGSGMALFLALLAGGAWTCLDDLAVTGDAFRLPYLLHDRQYNVAPVLWFLPLRSEPAYSHPRLAAQHGSGGSEVSTYRGNRPRWQFPLVWMAASVLSLGWAMVASLTLVLLVPVAWPDIVFRKMAIVAGAVLLALGLETFHYEHYTAPAWAALALMFALWSERAWNFRIGNKRAGAALVLLVLGSPLIFAGKPLSSSASLWPAPRAALIRRLSALGRRQLVIVRYPSPDWRVGNEWVYNGADIDSQQVVFAHDLGVERNRMLLDYYPERAPLLLTFDGTTGQDHLEPYPR